MDVASVSNLVDQADVSDYHWSPQIKIQFSTLPWAARDA